MKWLFENVYKEKNEIFRLNRKITMNLLLYKKRPAIKIWMSITGSTRNIAQNILNWWQCTTEYVTVLNHGHNSIVGLTVQQTKRMTSFGSARAAGSATYTWDLMHLKK